MRNRLFLGCESFRDRSKEGIALFILVMADCELSADDDNGFGIHSEQKTIWCSN